MERKTQWSGIEYIRKTVNGRPVVVTKREEVLRDVQDHFQNWFRNPPDVVDPAAAVSDSPVWKSIYSPSHLDINPNIYDDLMSPITDEILNDTISQLPKKKAPGVSGIPNEFFSHTDQRFRSVLSQLLSACLLHRDIPDDWKKALIFTIPKTQSWTGDLDKLRPVGKGTKFIKSLLN